MEQGEDKKRRSEKEEWKGERGRMPPPPPPLFLASQGFITLCDNSSWRLSVKSRPRRYSSASRLPLYRFTLTVTYLFKLHSQHPEYNSSATMEVTTDKEKVHMQTHMKKSVCKVKPRNTSSYGAAILGIPDENKTKQLR